MKSLRTRSTPLIAAFRCTSLLSVILLFSSSAGWAQALPAPSADLLAKLEGIYKDLHANP